MIFGAPGPLTGSVAFDGWVGAVAGAIVSVLVAVYVLRRTLKHDRQMFREQLAEERATFAEQSERDRSLAIEQERFKAFADLAAELMRAEDRIGAVPIQDAFLPVVSAYHRWTLYIPEIDDEFVRGVNRGIGTVRETAMAAVRRAREHALTARSLMPGQFPSSSTPMGAENTSIGSSARAVLGTCIRTVGQNSSKPRLSGFRDDSL